MSTTKERPILFSGPMVVALLQGRKKQTRRAVNPQPEFRGSGDSWYWCGGGALMRAGYGAKYIHTDQCAMERAMSKSCPYGQPGDRLWVKETFSPQPHLNAKAYFRATDPLVGVKKWKPSIFMPRNLSRIALEITAIRVERLQDISESDALAEGINMELLKMCHVTPQNAYRKLWTDINGKGSWEQNPWVWVIDFQKYDT